jgi:hypothetical protein
LNKLVVVLTRLAVLTYPPLPSPTIDEIKILSDTPVTLGLVLKYPEDPSPSIVLAKDDELT